MLDKNRIKFLFIFCGILLLQSCLCYKGTSTQYGHPRKKVKKNVGTNKIVSKVIDTLALYEKVTHITGKNIYNSDNSLGKSFFRFYPDGKFSSFVRMGYDRNNYKLKPNYKFSRKDFEPSNSQMGYYYSKNNKIYLKCLIMNQCRIDIYESEIIVNGDTITETYLQDKNSKRIYIKRKVPKEFLENWKPDW